MTLLLFQDYLENHESIDVNQVKFNLLKHDFFDETCLLLLTF